MLDPRTGALIRCRPEAMTTPSEPALSCGASGGATPVGGGAAQALSGGMNALLAARGLWRRAHDRGPEQGAPHHFNEDTASSSAAADDEYSCAAGAAAAATRPIVEAEDDREELHRM